MGGTKAYLLVPSLEHHDGTVPKVGAFASVILPDLLDVGLDLIQWVYHKYSLCESAGGPLDE